MIRGLRFTKFKGGPGDPGSGHHGHAGRPGSVGGSAPSEGISSAKREFLQHTDRLVREHSPKEFAAALVLDDTDLGFRIGSRVKQGDESSVPDWGLKGSSESGMIHSHPPGKKAYPSNSDVKVLSKISQLRQARGWQFAIVGGGQIKVWSGNKYVKLSTDRQLYAAVQRGLVQEQTFRLSDLKE